MSFLKMRRTSTAIFLCATLCAIAAAYSLHSQATVRQSYKQRANSGPKVAAEDKLDPNTATLDQLLRLPGITEIWATRVIKFRPYKHKQDLLDHGIVNGIVYLKVKNYLIVHREKPE